MSIYLPVLVGVALGVVFCALAACAAGIFVDVYRAVRRQRKG